MFYIYFIQVFSGAPSMGKDVRKNHGCRRAELWIKEKHSVMGQRQGNEASPGEDGWVNPFI